jgi:hypothetical protein
MSDTKPDPLIYRNARKLCPVCGSASYSPSGVHPQCAMQQNDAPRVARLKILRKANEDKKKLQGPYAKPIEARPPRRRDVRP